MPEGDHTKLDGHGRDDGDPKLDQLLAPLFASLPHVMIPRTRVGPTFDGRTLVVGMTSKVIALTPARFRTDRNVQRERAAVQRKVDTPEVPFNSRC